MIGSKLHIDSVTKSYNNRVILSDIFLSCKQGEIKGLIGRNGSGKSVLLKIIFGTVKSDSKFIKVDNKIIKNVNNRKGLINYLPQHNFLPQNTKVKTLINLFLSIESRNILFENELIKPLINKNTHMLSGGQKRVLEILLVIHSKAQFILLDEPFNGVSPLIKEYIIQYIKNVKKTKGFIITDHDYRNVFNLADEIVFLKNGYLKNIQDKEELVELGYLTENN